MVSPLLSTVASGTDSLHRRGGDDDGPLLPDSGDLLGIQMVAVDIGDQNQVRRGLSGVVSPAPGVDVDHFLLPFQDEGSMVDRNHLRSTNQTGQVENADQTPLSEVSHQSLLPVAPTPLLNGFGTV